MRHLTTVPENAGEQDEKTTREIALECFMEGHKLGKDVEELHPVSKSTAAKAFNTFWELNYDSNEG